MWSFIEQKAWTTMADPTSDNFDDAPGDLDELSLQINRYRTLRPMILKV
jgi:hypothetical protein